MHSGCMHILEFRCKKSITICCTRTQLRAASLWFTAQTLPHKLALLRWAGKQGVRQMQISCRIETPRLVLREFEHEDWHALHEHYSDAECTKFTFRRALTEGESWRAMASMVGHWQLRGYGPYAVEERATGKVIGAVGLWYPNDWPAPEIKWALSRAYWGNGFASEAVRAVQATVAHDAPDLKLISFIHSDNSPSIKLALAVGATLEKKVEFRGGIWHIYRHHSPELCV